MQAKSSLLAPSTTEDAWPELSAAVRSRAPSQPSPLPRELAGSDNTRGLDLLGLEGPQTPSTLFADPAVPPERDVWTLSTELREQLLQRIGDTLNDVDQRPSSEPSSEAPPAAPVTTPAAHSRQLPLYLGALTLVLGAAVIVGGMALVVVAQRTVTAGSSPAAATGQLSIVSDVPGARVSIDGGNRGVTPLEVGLDSGPHTVQLTSGGRRETMTVFVTSGVHAVHYVGLASPDRVPVGGALRVSTPVPGARITLDGEYRGLTPMTFAQVEPGFHEVAVVQGRVTERHEVSVEQDRTTEISVGFAPSPPVTSRASGGWIVITCPIPVEIWENGVLVGSSAVARVMVASGSHVLDFVNTAAGYRTGRTIDVVAGKTMHVTLAVPQGTLSVNAMPWAELWVDGLRVGETPLGNVPVPIGQRDVVLKHPQLGERRLQVLVRADTPARVTVDMRK